MGAAQAALAVRAAVLRVDAPRPVPLSRLDLAGKDDGIAGARIATADNHTMGQQLLDGAVDAVSTYWNHAAKLEAAGMSRLPVVDDATVRLGIEPVPALIGFVWGAGRTPGDLVGAFLASVSAAQDILAESDPEWDRLRPHMEAESGLEFRFLRDQFRAGIARDWRPGDTAAASALHRLLVETGGDVRRSRHLRPETLRSAG